MTEFTCELCGCELHEDDLQVFGDTTLCPDCLEERTVFCENCGERIWIEDNAGNDDLYLCQHCYDHQYTTCEDCGCILSYDEAFDHGDGDGPYCCHCHERRQKNPTIQNYYYKPTPIFFGSGPRFFGVELELDLGGEDADRAARILALGTIQGRVGMYAKHDSSLDDGFDLVTHPISYDCHMNEFPWADVLQEARRLGNRSHQARTCGLHIHVSRRAFGTTTAQQDAGIARVLYFVERHWEELMTFSRRTPSQMEQWAAMVSRISPRKSWIMPKQATTTDGIPA